MNAFIIFRGIACRVPLAAVRPGSRSYGRLGSEPTSAAPIMGLQSENTFAFQMVSSRELQILAGGITYQKPLFVITVPTVVAGSGSTGAFTDHSPECPCQKA